jgi:hypothetical protein
VYVGPGFDESLDGRLASIKRLETDCYLQILQTIQTMNLIGRVLVV